MMTRRFLPALCLASLAVGTAQGPTPGEPLTLLYRDSRRPLPTVTVDGRRMVAVSQLAGPFDLTVDENPQPGRLILTRGTQAIVLTAEQGLVSVSGRIVSLTSAPLERDGDWYVPIDFIDQALALVSDESIEFRRRSGLVLFGDIRVPQIVGRFQRNGVQRRVRLMISPAAGHAVAQEPDRLLVTFEADALDLVLPDVPEDDLVAGLRGIDTPPALAIDLRGSLESYSVATEPAIAGAIELIIDLLPSAATTPVRGGRRLTETTADPDLPALDLLIPARTIRVIAIDPGHGGDDAGTRGPNGTLEKNVTLEIALLLARRIERDLGLLVVLTRTSDTTVALDERAAIANNNRADLFISLHANASVRETATGAEVFHLSLAEYSEEVQAVEAGGQPVPTVGGGSRTLDIVPWELAQMRHVHESARWAAMVAQELGLRLPMSPRGLQQAPFRVLVGANMPAVLVEMGFISNPVQEAQLTSPSFQASIVNGLLRSIIQYRDEMARGVPLIGPPVSAPTDRPDTSGSPRR